MEIWNKDLLADPCVAIPCWLQVCLQHMPQWANTGAWCYYCSPWPKTETGTWQPKARDVKQKGWLRNDRKLSVRYGIISLGARPFADSRLVMSPRLESCPLWQAKDDLTLASVSHVKILKSVKTCRCADQTESAYLLDRQGDVFQYTIFYFQLIHHWSVGSLEQVVSWLPKQSSCFAKANTARLS